jgi:dGTPase
MDDKEELPQGYIDEAESEGHARVVADYIAGMTDTFILQQYAGIKRVVKPTPRR